MKDSASRKSKIQKKVIRSKAHEAKKESKLLNSKGGAILFLDYILRDVLPKEALLQIEGAEHRDPRRMVQHSNDYMGPIRKTRRYTSQK